MTKSTWLSDNELYYLELVCFFFSFKPTFGAFLKTFCVNKLKFLSHNPYWQCLTEPFSHELVGIQTCSSTSVVLKVLIATPGKFSSYKDISGIKMGWPQQYQPDPTLSGGELLLLQDPLNLRGPGPMGQRFPFSGNGKGPVGCLQVTLRTPGCDDP